MIDFLAWYFYRAPRAHLFFIYHTLTFFEDFMGIHNNMRYFFAPIFGDKSFFGRVMSILIRTLVIFAGLLSFLILATSLLFIPVAWFTALALWLINPFVLAVPSLAAIYYTIYGRKRPTAINPVNISFEQIEKYTEPDALKFIYPPFDTNYFTHLLQSPSVIHFLQRVSLSSQIFTEIYEHNKEYDEKVLTEKINWLNQTYKLRSIRAIHFFIAHLLMHEKVLEKILQKEKSDIEHFKKYIQWEQYEHTLYYPPHIWDEDYKQNTNGGTNLTWQGTVTPTLNLYSRDLTMQASNHPIRVVRQQIVNEIEQGLQKSQSASVLLVGDIGVGKDKLVEIIAQEINRGTIRGFLWSKRIVQLDLGRLYAGVTEKGAFEGRVEGIIEEINRSGNIVLYLNDFKSALEINASGTISLLSLLQDPIAKNKLHIIGSVTPRELTMIENENPHFIQEFTVIHIGEPEQYETTSILFNEALEYEKLKPVFFPYRAIEQIYEYASEYIKNDHFPQKGLKLLEDVVGYAASQRLATQWATVFGQRTPIVDEVINATISQKLHIKVGDTLKEESEKLLHLEEIFSEKVIGQSDAVKAVAEVLRRNRMGLRNKSKPIGSFLFVGPTGVGKTKMAKVLAEEYFGEQNRMIRFDMSEFQTTESIDRLIGSPSRGNDYLTLTEQLKNQPFSLVLLDELEKAHPRILDLFLQVLDDARLSDAFGETVMCNEAIFIATSNAGTQEITQMFQNTLSPTRYQDINKEIYHILSNDFRIEFLNRFDDIIVFKPLTPPNLRKIVNNELKQISEKIYEDKKIKVKFSENTIKQIISEGYNPELGARPLERAIQNIVESNLAKQLLNDTLEPGSAVII